MGSNFPWTYSQSVSRGEFNAEDVLYYEHPLYTRPEINGFSEPVSDYFQLSFKVMREILTENDIDARRYFLLRMNINCTLPSDVPRFSRRHSDHSFDHMNFILYLTGNGGSTYPYGGAGSYSSTVFSMQDEGVSGTDKNLPPYYALTYIIKY